METALLAPQRVKGLVLVDAALGIANANSPTQETPLVQRVLLSTDSLRDALVKGLPSAGVRTAYLACVPGTARDVLRPVMSLRAGELLEGDGAEYPASQLLPPGALADETRETFLVLPLAFENHLLGVIAFSYSDGINAYAAFRNEIQRFPKDRDAYGSLAAVYLLQGRVGDAQAVLQQLVAANPSRSSYDLAADVCEHFHQPGAAAEWRSRGAAFAP